MRAKDFRTDWYFDIINPVLAEFCRKNKIAVYITGNMIQSKGNIPYSIGTSRVQEPRFMVSRKGCGPANPAGGSIARWFAEMGQSTGILNDNMAQRIMALATSIDKYTYFYEIEQTCVAPDTFGSFIAIEKRLWDECNQYGFTENEFDKYRKERRQGDVPVDLSFYIFDNSESEPLCERLNEGVISRNPSRISWCELSAQLVNQSGLRKIIQDSTRKVCAVSHKCTIPCIDFNSDLPTSIEGNAFAITSISGKKKTTIIEFIKRNGGTVALDYSPKSEVFIGENISREKFIEENGDYTIYIPYRLIRNPLLNGLARRELGEKIYIALEESFWAKYQSKEVIEDESDQPMNFDSNGNLLMSMAQAERFWTVKTTKAGFSIGKYSGSEKELHVPAYIDGKPVVTIDKGKKNDTVQKLVIPKTVKKINAGAFPHLSQLREIIFNSTETEVASGAFSDCPHMFDENDCFVANGVLQDCRQSGDVTIPGYAHRIPNDFAKKSSIKNMKSLTIQDGVEEIGWSAFSSCEKLQTVSVSNTVKNIWNGAFMECQALESITIGDSVEYIAYVAFSHCKMLRHVILGRSIKKIDTCAFDECELLTDINYNGTKHEWYSITKGDSWGGYNKRYTVHCIDETFEY